MKYCPTCRTQYTDDSLRFCLQDGANLVDRLEADTPTVAFAETPTVPAYRVTKGEPQPEQVTQAAAAKPVEKKTTIAIPVLLTAAVMLFLFAIIGIGVWLYAKSGRVDPPANIAANTGNINGTVPANQGPYFPTPSASASPTRSPTASVTPPPFPTPPPTGDPERARREVSQSVNGWKSMAEARNLNAYMDNYADTVDYYRRSSARRAFVRADKARAFGIYDSIRLNISNLNVSVDESGTTATATFDKEWDFRGTRTSSGKVQQQLNFRNESGRWVITGERDLRVYYMR